MKTLDSFIAQNSSSVIIEFLLNCYPFEQISVFKAEVEKWLETACEALPSAIRDECKAFVAEYEPIIATLISNQISPDKVCQFIKVCPKSKIVDIQKQVVSL